MKKIPTVFERTEDRKHVVDHVAPGCEWVLAGEGTATRKFDGTCVLIERDGIKLWARREVKRGKEPPADFRLVDVDETTGKAFGWEPAIASGFAKFLSEAIRGDEEPGTYELCGPKINGNPEHYTQHVLVRHGAAEIAGLPRDFDGLRAWLANSDFEGVVWHHPDGRMAKLKRRDFPA